MRIIGNILWFILVGFGGGLGWIISGILNCITIIGIPFGLQAFKLSKLAFFPFGKEARYISDRDSALGCLGNVIWMIFGGLELAIGYALAGIVCYITIIGIPFGIQCMKLAALALTPFGKEIVKIED
jgi:uncharacterized membrane protein YccF (DUF307 family)